MTTGAEGSPKREAPPLCPLCRDIGWVYHDVPLGHELFGQVKRCACRFEADQQEKALSMLKYCQLPIGSEGYTFERYDCKRGSKEAYEAALALAKGELLWLVLNGGRDRGKTHLAVAICRYWLSANKVARYVHVPLLLDELRAGFGDEERDFEERFNHFKNVPLLVMDDLGVQSPTSWTNEKIQTLVDYRYINQLPLVVTVNKSLSELPGDDEGRVESRLKRMVASKVVLIEAPEYRTVRG